MWTAAIPVTPNFNFTEKAKIEDPAFALLQIDPFIGDEREMADKRGKVVLPNTPTRLLHIQTNCCVHYSDDRLAPELKLHRGESSSLGLSVFSRRPGIEDGVCDLDEVAILAKPGENGFMLGKDLWFKGASTDRFVITRYEEFSKGSKKDVKLGKVCQILADNGMYLSVKPNTDVDFDLKLNEDQMKENYAEGQEFCFPEYMGELRADLSTNGEDGNSYWVLEGEDRFLGGELKVGTAFYLRHIASQRYLSADLSLTNKLNAKTFSLFSPQDSQIELGQFASLMTGDNDIVLLELTPSLSSIKTQVFGSVLSDLDPGTVLRLSLTTSTVNAKNESLKFSVLSVDQSQANDVLELGMYLTRLSEMRLALQHLMKQQDKESVINNICNRFSLSTLSVSTIEHTFKAQIASDFQIVNEMLRIWVLKTILEGQCKFLNEQDFFTKLGNYLQNIQFYERVSKNLFTNRQFMLSIAAASSSTLADILEWTVKAHLPKENERLYWVHAYFSIFNGQSTHNAILNITYFLHYLLDRLPVKIHLRNIDFMKIKGEHFFHVTDAGQIIYHCGLRVMLDEAITTRRGFTVASMLFLADFCALSDLKDEVITVTGLDVNTCASLCKNTSKDVVMQMAVVYFISKVHIPGCCNLPALTDLTDTRVLDKFSLQNGLRDNEDWFHIPNLPFLFDFLVEYVITFWLSLSHDIDEENANIWFFNAVVTFRLVAKLIENCAVSDIFVASMVNAAVAITWMAFGVKISGFSHRFPFLNANYRIETEKQRVVDELLELLLMYRRWKLVKIMRCCVGSEAAVTKRDVQIYVINFDFKTIVESYQRQLGANESTMADIKESCGSSEYLTNLTTLLDNDTVTVSAILKHIAYNTSFGYFSSHQVVFSLLESELDFAEYAMDHMRKIQVLDPHEFYNNALQIRDLVLSPFELSKCEGKDVFNLTEFIAAMEKLVDALENWKERLPNLTLIQDFFEQMDFITDLRRAWNYCAEIPANRSEDEKFVTLRTLTIEASRLYVLDSEPRKKQLLHIFPMQAFYPDYPQFIKLLTETRLLDTGSDVASNIIQVIFKTALEGSQKRFLLAIKALLGDEKLLSMTIFTMIQHYNTVEKDKLSKCEWEIMILASQSINPEARIKWLAPLIRKWYNTDPSAFRREEAAMFIFSQNVDNNFFKAGFAKAINHLTGVVNQPPNELESDLKPLLDLPKAQRDRNFLKMGNEFRYVLELSFEKDAGLISSLCSWKSAENISSLVKIFATLYRNISDIAILHQFSSFLYEHLNKYLNEAEDSLPEDVKDLLSTICASPPRPDTLEMEPPEWKSPLWVFKICEKKNGMRALVSEFFKGKLTIGSNDFTTLKKVFLTKKEEDIYMEACLQAVSLDCFQEAFKKKEKELVPLIDELLELAMSHRIEKMQALALKVLVVIVDKILDIRFYVIELLQHRQFYIRFFSRFATFIEKRKKLVKLIQAEKGAFSQTLSERLLQVNDVLQRFLELFQKFCDGCYLPFQNYLRIQGEDIHSSINIVSLATTLLVELLKSPEDPSAAKLIVSSCFALQEMVTGPCSENQVEVCSTFGFVTELMKVVELAAVKEMSADLEVERSLVVLILALLEGKEQNFEEIETMMGQVNFDIFLRLSESFAGKLTKETLRKMELGLTVTSLEEAQFKISTNCLIVYFSAMQNEKIDLVKEHPLRKYIASVELEQPTDTANTLHTIFFCIPFIARFLTKQTAMRVLTVIDRQSRHVKLEDFTGKVALCEVEMKHRQLLARYTWLNVATKYWLLYLRASFVLVVALNLLLIGFVQDENDQRFEIEKSGEIAIIAIGVLQAILIAFGTFSYYLEFWHTLRRPINPRDNSSPVEKLPYIQELGEDSGIYFSSKSILPFQFNLREVIKLVIQLTYALLSAAAIWAPFLYPILLFQIINLNHSVVTILKSVTERASQLLLALFFALIVIFAHTFYAYFYLYEYYKNENGLYCENLHKCFFSTINMGLRSGGGIGDAMGATAETDFYVRMFFDLLFYITITTVLMAIVFGLIIDTFSDLRDKLHDMEVDMNNVCLICGHQRSVIEVKGEGWEAHTLRIHNPFNYMYFQLYTRNKAMRDCSGIEKWVKSCLEKHNISFYPTTSVAIGREVSAE